MRHDGKETSIVEGQAVEIQVERLEGADSPAGPPVYDNMAWDK